MQYKNQASKKFLNFISWAENKLKKKVEKIPYWQKKRVW